MMNEGREELRLTMLSKVERWVDKLPPDERELPQRRIKGRWVTPLEMVGEVRNKSTTGWSIAEEMEVGIKPEVDRDLIAERLRRRIEMLKRSNIDPENIIVASWGEPYSKGYSVVELLREVEEETEIGKQFVDDQKEYFEYLESLMEE